ncbi:hypothetical protein AB6A40_001665 [Gnathostoma spinigerum]|uniref:UDENN domain-containing protein n=1 Tax=Gnathostoma spinigerum TaxID=75299 RepID=A0ABD6E718_9BILA
MSSRNRSNIVTLFDVFCEVGAGFPNGTSVILQKYPEDFNCERTLKSITQFSFPCGLDDGGGEAVQLFSFVLTDEKSQYTYAFCRYTPRNNTCLSILSGFPWSNIFYKFLNEVSEVMNNGSPVDVDALLTCAYHTPIPNAGEKLVIQTTSEAKVRMLEFIVPDASRLPTLKEDKYMLEFYNAVDEKQLIALYASLLRERRILFTGQKLSQLSSCIFATATLLLPMQWQNLFIPVLPSDLTDMLMAPMPYLIGIPKKTLQTATNVDFGDVVVVDLDERRLQSAHDDVADLPSEAVALLKHQLRSSADMFLSDGLSRCFLRTNVYLFGGYRSGLCRSSTSYIWDHDKFVNSQKPNLQPFLRALIGQEGVQYFERFIQERLEALNAGTPINDEFEREIRLLKQKQLRSSQLTSPPEVLQQAVSTVRENANDMFDALKGKVQSIALKERLGRITPKEFKRISSKKSMSYLNEETPMSFDTQQWIDNESSTEADSTVRSADTVTVADLIDLSDDPSAECNAVASVSRSVPPSTSISPAPLAASPFSQPHHLSLHSFDFTALDTADMHKEHSTPERTSTYMASTRTEWQRFD